MSEITGYDIPKSSLRVTLQQGSQVIEKAKRTYVTTFLNSQAAYQD